MEPISTLLQSILATTFTHFIFVVHDPITRFEYQSLVKVSELRNYRMEVFLWRELVINVSHHSLVPEHVLLTKSEGVRVLSEINCTPLQLPKIFANDPQARYHGASVGDIFRINRRSETAGKTKCYRIVVAPSPTIFK